MCCLCDGCTVAITLAPIPDRLSLVCVQTGLCFLPAQGMHSRNSTLFSSGASVHYRGANDMQRCFSPFHTILYCLVSELDFSVGSHCWKSVWKSVWNVSVESQCGKSVLEVSVESQFGKSMWELSQCGMWVWEVREMCIVKVLAGATSHLQAVSLLRRWRRGQQYCRANMYRSQSTSDQATGGYHVSR